jgi:hypothetical protein
MKNTSVEHLVRKRGFFIQKIEDIHVYNESMKKVVKKMDEFLVEVYGDKKKVEKVKVKREVLEEESRKENDKGLGTDEIDVVISPDQNKK